MRTSMYISHVSPQFQWYGRMSMGPCLTMDKETLPWLIKYWVLFSAMLEFMNAEGGHLRELTLPKLFF